jgi:prevent-host-death family protein
MEVGLREANQRFSNIMKAVRRGEEVMLTERGKPLARIIPIRAADTSETVIRRLEETGLLRPASRPRPMPVWEPRPIEGESIAQTLREERESS